MQNDDRVSELMELSASMTKDISEGIVSREIKLAHNKNLVIELLSQGIIKEIELKDIIERCFQRFLSEVSEAYGNDICQDIYEYLPGDKLGFLNEYEPVDGVDAIKLAAVELTEALELICSFPADKTRERATLKLASDDLNAISLKLSRRIIHERKVITDVSLGLVAEASVIRTTILPEFTSVLSDSNFNDINTKIRSVTSDLEDLESQLPLFHAE
ncbi:hypothetical protein JK628_10575 [Shewanella sp. KX20019]|uniref:hypothetical protein n=1 Tax=Shewanella sp. KX20019 TaxID=2803864 RepID=UPI0019296D20|nr:hypothetical protein [Shewanella sp. KX20019]QQX82206.1 hypothetical protein JK628_10575 [Shewanella sp. KX20019]